MHAHAKPPRAPLSQMALVLGKIGYYARTKNCPRHLWTAFSILIITFSFNIQLKWFKMRWKDNSNGWNSSRDTIFSIRTFVIQSMSLKLKLKIWNITFISWKLICKNTSTIFHSFDFQLHPIDLIWSSIIVLLFRWNYIFNT